jgi:hypothetical protein
VSINIGEQHMLRGTPDGDRVIAYLAGGSFEGPKLKGDVLPGGGDWFIIRPDGVGTLDVRLLLKTDDGELIYMTYRGVARMPKERGEPLRPRTGPTFCVAMKSKYAWLNEVQAVGEGETFEGGIKYRISAVR